MLHFIESIDEKMWYNQMLDYIFQDYKDVIQFFLLGYDLEKNNATKLEMRNEIVLLNEKIKNEHWNLEYETWIIESFRENNKKMIDQMYSTLIWVEAKEKESSESINDKNESDGLINNLFIS